MDFNPILNTVLIVEDDEAIRDTMQLVVESEGFNALTARNGKEALDILGSGACPTPCLILLDLMMPEMNGWQFLEATRAAHLIQAIPVVITSAIGNRSNLPHGAMKILRKPLELENLSKNLHDLCDPDKRLEIMQSGSVGGFKKAA